MSLRLAFISDLHVDYQMEAVGLVAGRLAELEPDVFVVAGDVSPDPRMLHKTLSLLAEVGPPTLFVPGNHDLWCRSPRHGEAPPQGPDSRELYEEVLPMLASRAGAVFLPAAPWVHGDVGFVGVTGWYDWTFLDEAEEQPFSRVVLEAGRLGSLQWMDGVCSYWTNREGDAISPKKVARAMAMNLDRNLKEVEQHVDKVVVVTHFLTHPGFFELNGEPRHDFVIAHAGSVELGKVIDAHPKVQRVISGHYHTPKRKDSGGVVLETSPLGYPRERSLPLFEHVKNRVVSVTV